MRCNAARRSSCSPSSSTSLLTLSVAPCAAIARPRTSPILLSSAVSSAMFRPLLRSLVETGGAPFGAPRNSIYVRASSPPGAAASASDSAHEQADHEEQGRDHGDDEQPVDREAHADEDDRQDGEQDEQCHRVPPFRKETVERRSRLRLPRPSG